MGNMSKYIKQSLVSTSTCDNITQMLAPNAVAFPPFAKSPNKTLYKSNPSNQALLILANP